MAGRLNGAATIVQREPGAGKAKYFHCAAYALNLCIVGMSNVIPVRNMWSTLRQVALFFNNSPKRQQFLEQFIATKIPESARKKVVDLCKTRWVARNDALSVFHQLYPAIVDTLTTISIERGWNQDSSSAAASLLANITQFTFIATFIVTSKIMEYSEHWTLSRRIN